MAPADPPARTHALLTGASAGIGAALARPLAKRHEIWLAARRLDRLEALAAEIRAAGGVAHTIALDVSDPDATAARVTALDAEVGGFDLVVANAGIGGNGRRTSTMTYAEARDMFMTNTLGAIATLLPVVQPMIARAKAGRRGHIVGVSSIAAELPVPVANEYGASKAALTYFLEGAAGELPALGVDVSIVHPGFVKTDLTAKNKFRMPFIIEADEAARIIDEGIARKAHLIRFPRALALASTLGTWLPRTLKDAIVSRRA